MINYFVKIQKKEISLSMMKSLKKYDSHTQLKTTTKPKNSKSIKAHKEFEQLIADIRAKNER